MKSWRCHRSGRRVGGTRWRGRGWPTSSRPRTPPLGRPDRSGWWATTHRSAGRRRGRPGRRPAARGRRRSRPPAAARPAAALLRGRAARRSAARTSGSTTCSPAHRGGHVGQRTDCTSWPASSTWNDSDIVRITPTSWRATTLRVTKERPSRTGDLEADRLVGVAAADEVGVEGVDVERPSTVAAPARRPWATICPPYSPPHGYRGPRPVKTSSPASRLHHPGEVHRWMLARGGRTTPSRPTGTARLGWTSDRRCRSRSRHVPNHPLVIPPVGRRRRALSGPSPSPHPPARAVVSSARTAHPADAHQHPRRLPRRRRALRDVLRVHRRGRGARVIVPLPGVPTEVIRGGDWTLQRLAEEVAPVEEAAFAADSNTGRGVGRGDPRDADRCPRHHGAGGRRRRGRPWARDNGFLLTPDAPEVLDFYGHRSQIFMAARFDAARAASLGQTAGDGTPIMLTIPADAPWVPLRILSLGLEGEQLVEADVFLLTDEDPTSWPAVRACASSAASRPTTCSSTTSAPTSGWSGCPRRCGSPTSPSTPAKDLDYDLAVSPDSSTLPTLADTGVGGPRRARCPARSRPPDVAARRRAGRGGAGAGRAAPGGRDRTAPA